MLPKRFAEATNSFFREAKQAKNFSKNKTSVSGNVRPLRVYN